MKNNFTRRYSGVREHLHHPLTRSLYPDLKTKLHGVQADRCRSDRSGGAGRSGGHTTEASGARDEMGCGTLDLQSAN